MVGKSSDPSSLKEYLKKYTSNDDKDKKRKQKKKPKRDAAGVVVVDEDPIWQKPVKLDEEEENSADEEKPQVDEDIDVKRMRRLELLRSKRPFGVVSEDGSGWVSVSNVSNNMKSENQSSDISPPRRRSRNDTPSPEPQPRSNSPAASDISPPRKRRPRNDTPSPEPQQQSNFPAASDLSPPRQLRKRYQSRPLEPETKASRFPGGRNARHDTPSPERHPKDAVPHVLSDLPPPRKQQKDKHVSSPEAGRISLHSRAAMDSDISPPRRAPRDSRYQDDSRISSVADLSPPRKSKNDRSRSTVSSSKSINNLDDQDTNDPGLSVSDLSPPRKRQKESSISSHRPKTALLSAEDIKDEIDKKRKEEWLRFKEMDPSVSGRGAEPTYRNKLTGERMSKEDFLQSRKKEQRKEEKPKEIKVEWDKGLAQKREAEARLREMEAEKDKPFALSRDDPDRDAMLKERVRWGDPMAHLVKKKDSEPVLPDLGDSEKMKESGFIIPQEIPTHSWIRRGLDAAPNRYGIKPGRHWDGVDRSNGYEKELFKRMNERKATEMEAYLWSVSEM